MGFAQLYYTSCESGLSGFAGFQFNAATPGLPPQLLREVEALTSYEPPRSLGYRPGPAEIAACPVNLVYRCEPTTVLANVVFLGLDFSQRLGNYFAHAIVGQTEADRFEAILPIELWGAPVWAEAPVAERELPVLPARPEPAAPGRLTRAGVDRFLAARGEFGGSRLAVLVTAAEAAVLGRGRSIVIVEDGSTAAAHWIAAISFLLPAPVARRMSFATYRHRPEYSDAHVIATLPESDFDLGDAAFHSYVVFDAPSARISEVDPEPAAALLVRAGAEGATRLWARAGGLVDVADLPLARSCPALIVAWILAGEEAGFDLDVLREWLEPVLDHPALDPPQLRRLGELAHRAETGWAGTGPVRSEQADSEPAEQRLRAGGEQVLGPVLVRTGSPALIEALAGSRALLDGALAHLATVVAQEPEPVIEVFARGLGEVLKSSEIPCPTIELDLAATLARCRQELLGPDLAEPGHVRATRDWLVRAILEPARDGPYLDAYLRLCQAVEAPSALVGPLIGAAHNGVTAFLATARDLAAISPETGTESDPDDDRAQAETLRRLIAAYPGHPAPVQDLLRATLPEVIDRLAGSAHLPAAVAGCPPALVTAWLDTARDRLAQIPADVEGAAVLFLALRTLRSGGDQEITPALAEILRRGLRGRPQAEIEHLQDRLSERSGPLGADFAEWRKQHLGGPLSRSMHRLRARKARR